VSGAQSSFAISRAALNTAAFVTPDGMIRVQSVPDQLVRVDVSVLRTGRHLAEPRELGVVVSVIRAVHLLRRVPFVADEQTNVR